MDSTGQSLVTNGLLGSGETTLTADSRSSSGSLITTDKSLNEEGFSKIFGRQKEIGAAFSSDAGNSVIRAEASATGMSVQDISADAAQVLTGLSGNSLPVDGAVLPQADSSGQLLLEVEGTLQPDPTAAAAAVTGSETELELDAATVTINLTEQGVVTAVKQGQSEAGSVVPSGSSNPVIAVTTSLLPGRQSTAGAWTASAADPAQQPVWQTSATTIAKGAVPAASTNEAAAASAGQAVINSQNSPAVTTAMADLGRQFQLKPQWAGDKPGLQSLELAATTPADNTMPPGLIARGELAVATSQPAAGVLQAAVGVEVAKPGWSDNIMQRVMWMSAHNINRAEISLDPPELGPLQVRISTQADQTSIVFSSPHSVVRDALDQGLPRLREMMENQGVELADVDVAGQQGDSSSGQQDSEQQVAANRVGAGDDTAGQTGSDDQQLQHRQMMSGQQGLIDQYV